MTDIKEDFPYLPAHIANYFLWQADEDKINDITPMKLVKLVYFGYAWYYAVFNKKLFSEKIEAWRYGPVVPSVYHEFKRFASKPIDLFSVDSSLVTGEITYPVIGKEDKDTIQLLGAVWNIYKSKDGIELSRITHENGSPWHHTYAQGINNEIPDELIKNRATQAIAKYENYL
jgi:uncharacterized phage-associated protein